MKTKTLLLALLSATVARAQTDVTDTYIQNPDFSARYAAWLNEGATKGAVGGFTHQTNTDFAGKSGEVYMEKWVSTGGKVSDCSISQMLRDIPTGTYQLTVNAQNIQQNNTSATQTGAYVFAGDEQTEVSAQQDYSVTFSVIDGSVKIGFKTVSATGNWVAFDNFRLSQLSDDMDAIHAGLQALVTEAEGLGGSATDLDAALSTAQSLLTASTTDGVADAAKALERAILNYRLCNATGNTPIVETNPFVAMGTTIALGRGTVSENGATISEQGFCWSVDPEPTVLDDRTTEFFTNNGPIYRMEGLSPATVYYVRAYAMTEGYQVGYGDVVRIATEPMGSVTYSYNYGGSTEENYRINSALSECEWMYNNVADIQGFGISCSYGATTSTADCSYGGSMRVGPSSSYQQTGTILHETNHGVGVGTTNEWYSSSALRENTSSGKWLGPCANEMVQFLQDDAAAYMTGDDKHMWGATTSSITMKSYGINGADEDSNSSPADYELYWGNILITHALHKDGLPCSSSVGFATPAFVFEQWDGVKYYIKNEDENYSLGTYLGQDDDGTLKMVSASLEEAIEDDDLAWYISYNPETCYYSFQNAGTGKYIGLSGTTFKATTSAASIHLLPSRQTVSVGGNSVHSYWMTNGKGARALQAGSESCSTASWDNENSATTQRWLFLTADKVDTYEEGEFKTMTSNLDELIANVRATKATKHVATDEDDDVEEIDAALENTLLAIEAEESGYTSSEEFDEAVNTIEEALLSFLEAVTPADTLNPFNITYLLTNPALDEDNSGWSDTPTFNYSCCEYFTTSAFDFNQTTPLKMPAGTYELRVQAFQRPGTYSTVYTDYVTNGKDNVKAKMYINSRSSSIKNIYADAQTSRQSSTDANPATRVYIPNDMASAQAYFTQGLYDNSYAITQKSALSLKIGIRSTAASGSTEYWTCFDNFRLYFYGGYSSDDVTPVEAIEADEVEDGGAYYDLSGRQVSRPVKGIYIHDGKKVVVR
ncbi:MAG: hypothetical protein LUC33_03460 [Prevotellaceae bacterium]|nr:hypothetical protein [Prevotellaceae bacterium]